MTSLGNYASAVWQRGLRVLDLSRVSFGFEFGRDCNELHQLACSQPTCRVFEAVSLSLWIWRSVPCPLLVFFLPRSDGASPINLSYFVTVCVSLCVCVRACEIQNRAAERKRLKSSSSYISLSHSSRHVVALSLSVMDSKYDLMVSRHEIPIRYALYQHSGTTNKRLLATGNSCRLCKWKLETFCICKHTCKYAGNALVH